MFHYVKILKYTGNWLNMIFVAKCISSHLMFGYELLFHVDQLYSAPSILQMYKWPCHTNVYSLLANIVLETTLRLIAMLAKLLLEKKLKMYWSFSTRTLIHYINPKAQHNAVQNSEYMWNIFFNQYEKIILLIWYIVALYLHDFSK